MQKAPGTAKRFFPAGFNAFGAANVKYRRKNMAYRCRLFYVSDDRPGLLRAGGVLYKEDTDMKKRTGILMMLAVAFGVAVTAHAKTERKEQPTAREAEEALAAVGGEHNPEKMKVKRISSVQVGDTFFHIFEGKLDGPGYHIIVFDNYNNYLGYYKSAYPPCNYQRDQNIAIDSGTVDVEGDQLYYFIPISPEKGLPAKVEYGGTATQFVKNPNLQQTEKSEGEAGADGIVSGNGGNGGDSGKVVPEYREWTIKYKGQELTVRALYISQTFAEVTLKAEASGKEKAFLITDLSKEDREYIKQFK